MTRPVGSSPVTNTASALPPTLREGASGPAVTELQKLLDAKGHDVQPTGRFDAATKAAVMAFQQAAGTKADGVVGAATWTALKGAAAEPSGGAKPAAWSPRAPGAGAARPVQTEGKEPLEFDGHFVGAGQKAFDPEATRFDDVPGVKPNNGKSVSGSALIVNGIGTELEGAAELMQLYANSTGRKTVGLFNAPREGWADTLQSVLHKADLGENPAVENLGHLLYAKLKVGEGMNLMGYSQGALIVSRALTDVKQRLLGEGLTTQAAEQLLSKLNVETMGGASATFPDGPKYTHYVNDADDVPNKYGVTSVLGRPGRGAEVKRFSAGEDDAAHELEQYLKQWKAR